MLVSSLPGVCRCYVREQNAAAVPDYSRSASTFRCATTLRASDDNS
jgi:hypothetical protein